MSIPKKSFYTIEVLYRCQQETKRFRITNLTAEFLKQVRETMYVGGVYRKIDEDSGEIISPWNIIEAMIYKQAHYFNAEQENKPLENPNSNFKPKK